MNNKHFKCDYYMQTPEIARPKFGSSGEIQKASVPNDANGAEYLHHDNIFVAPSITEDSLSEFKTDPLLCRNIRGLGQVTLEKVRQTGGKRNQEEKVRTHRLYTLKLDEFRSAVEITDPADGVEPDFVIVSKPGLTEHITGGIRRQMQARLAYAFPNARIASIESDGIGQEGDRYNPYDTQDRARHDFDGQAAQRLLLARALAGDLPVVPLATSMGAPIAVRMVHQNYYSESADGKVNIAGQVWNVPALVIPERIVPDMVCKFLPKMSLGASEELLLKSSPRELFNIIRQGVIQSGFSKEDLPIMLHQISELLKGTPEELISEVLEAAPTLAITGEKDALLQQDMMARLKRKHGDKLHHVVVEGRGHELPMKPKKNVMKIQSALANCRQYGCFRPVVERALNTDFKAAA